MNINYPTPSDVMEERVLAAVRDVLIIEDVTWGAGNGKGVRIRGQLVLDPEQAYDIVAPRFEYLGYTALFRKEQDKDVILAMKGTMQVMPSSNWLALLLLFLTLLSTLFAGADATKVESEGWFRAILSGWPFAVSLIAILGTHELGHYFTARHFGVPVTLPYFIPMPLNILGTMGAFIRIKAPPKNRRHLLAIGAAGPLAGLAVAIPILLLGLHLSEVAPLPVGEPYLLEGNSLLYAALKILVFGRFLPSGGEDVLLHPVAFAGWAGLMITALNLIPAGQLDGGHIAFALFGDRAKRFTWLIIAALIGLGFLWSGWFLWAVLIFVFGRFVARPLDDITRPSSKERLLGIIMLIIFVLIFTPIPMRIMG